MTGILPRLTRGEEGRLWFTCPGCGDRHGVSIQGGGPRWTWNGSMPRPTFAPSLLITSGHHTRHHKPGDECWCTINDEERAAGRAATGFACYRCHSFVRDGQIQFLRDCTHDLAGKTVGLFDVRAVAP